MRLLVTYYKDVLGIKPKQRKVMLYEFCARHIKGFNKALYFKSINAALRNGGDKHQRLIVVDKIFVYKSELDYIQNLEIDYNAKKVIFTFLVNRKINKFIYEFKNGIEYTSLYFKGSGKQYGDIAKMSNIPSNIKINDDIIRWLAEDGLITIKHNGLISLDFIKNCNETGEIAIEITDYENIGWYLDFYNGVRNIIKCCECGRLIRKTNNKKKYCSDCAVEINRDKTKENINKSRNCLK